MKKFFLPVIALIVVILLLVLFKYISATSTGRTNNVTYSQSEEDKISPSSNDVLKPFVELFDENNYSEELSRNQYQHKPEKILPEPSS